MEKNNRIFLIIFFLLIISHLPAQKQPFNKEQIPQPIFEQNPELVDLYWKTWEMAYDHIKEQEDIPQSPYMDEAFWDDTIWIWDTEFMVLFCKYAPNLFPGIESLNNFYKSILDKETSSLKIQHPDNPPFFAWVESEYFNLTNDKIHLESVIEKNKYLQRHYDWFESLKPNTKLHFDHAYIALDKKGIGYKWGGIQSGMDNTPRGRNKQHEILWVDAIAQQALSALYISRLASYMDDNETVLKFKKQYETKKDIINTYYWDKEDGFYYDILEGNNTFVKVKTPASFWVMLAEVPNKKQAKKLMEYAKDPMEFGGEYPWPTVSKKDKDFNGNYGDYWRGGIWVPTAYMATKALEKYGFYEVADENAYHLLMLMLNTYKTYEPATIWECYNPTKPEPSQRVHGSNLEIVRPDFCGWSALAPISMFIENVLGFHEVNAQTKTIEWRKYRIGKHGIKNLMFGNIKTDIIAYDDYIEVTSNANYTLKINGKKYKVKKGNQRLKNSS
ncbi:trehalase family glycosidase [Flavivirga sp. 57AJ16]|uniref:MGH1-like glycoside hydrolase domain-containing protein n=1 Tax=Flavivirga sp. 57AJ16 TaxID=3025307 RepID=UPI0023672A67|nr:trehalase family glycosidase [Flavivirga sp. 57AJ16]MDD7887731.1 trehalase family glycosidase [Flavivirga sp. 57AJ16]